MSISHIPNGFTSITPFFLVEDPNAFIVFLKEAFDAEQFEFQEEDGSVRHFGFRVFDSVVEGGPASAEHGATKMSIHLYVKDCDTVYEKAIAAGGSSIHDVMDMPYGERSGGVLDPCGNSWWIATQKSDMYPT